ncbi:unnamed protein product [Symbiodinium sp. KB8]|nr:unnamed protein product [Symbiodinium sp. KB8]
MLLVVVFACMLGACFLRGRMAVYSQQPTFSGARSFCGVHSDWWRPTRTADKSSAAPWRLLLTIAADVTQLPVARGLQELEAAAYGAQRS